MSFRRPLGILTLVLLCAFGARAQSTAPALLQPLPAQSMLPNSAAVSFDLTTYFGLPGVTGQVAQIETVLGKFNVELLSADAPRTVVNFLNYVNRGAYTNTFIHRSVPGFVIQGGGFTLAGSALNPIPADAPVQNEFKDSNVRGTLAMAKTADGPDTATTQWFVNLGDNRHSIDPTTGQDLGLDVQNGGFTVFGRVLGTGMSVVDAIAALDVYDESSLIGGVYNQLPLLGSALTAENLVMVPTISVVPVYPSASSTTAVLSFGLTNSNPAAVTAVLSGATLTLTPVAIGSATITLTATDTNGNAVTGTIAVSVASSAPIFTFQPTSKTVAAGSTVAFSAPVAAYPAATYQWRRGNTPLPGATSALLVLKNTAAVDADTYTCVATNSLGTATSNAATLTLTTTTNPGRLINLSIFTTLGSAETMSMGTVLGGAGTTGQKAVLARAAGPSLASFGVASPLPDPKMALLATGATNATLATNDNWAGDPTLAAIFAQVGAFAYASGASKDAAIYQDKLGAGSYAVQVSGTGTGTGTVLAELYEATPGSSFTSTTPRLINLSVIKQIATNDSLSAGFVIGGSTAKTVLVRAIGPALGAFGVNGTMADPRLDVLSSGTVIAANDNWGGDVQLTSVATAVGAFAIGNASSTDAMVVITLPPGAYSARVKPFGNGGTALVEVYEVP